MYIAIAVTDHHGAVVSLHEDYDAAKAWMWIHESTSVYIHAHKITEGQQFALPWKLHDDTCVMERAA